MEPVVLVTYATRSGSTEEVARAVAEVLRERGFVLDYQPVRNVRDVGPYSAVVLAAPLYMFRLHNDARRFLSAHRAALMKVPVALFVPGPLRNEEKDWDGARQHLDNELAKFPWLLPVAHHIVGGAFDPAKLTFPFNLIPALRKMPASDIRDWPAIRDLAIGFAAMLKNVEQRPTVS